MTVVGMGEKKTSKPFISACDQFKYLDVLAESENLTNTSNLEYNKTSKENNETSKSMTDINLIGSTIIKILNESDNQSMTMAEISNRIAKRYPDFDVRNYGYTKLSKFLKKFDFLIIKTDRSEGNIMWVEMPPVPLIKRKRYKKKK